ncbi:stage III sporulation protein AB [Otoolea muris]|uniref:stage III sporulation protein AB n=1 Tax=Otoolea muris TaxID=2941515 RepID=UPI0020421EE7|nr:stage III sporulation protein AB [Otoolea muris]
MWMKLLGAALVVGSCTGFGLGAARRLRERRRLLEILRQMIFHLRGEILYANAPLSCALLRTGNRGSGWAAALFTESAKELEREGGEPFEVIWKRQVELLSGDTVLKEPDLKALLRFGMNLGYLDRDMQEKTMQLYLEELELALERLRREEPDKSRLLFGMGVLGGLFLTVILI